MRFSWLPWLAALPVWAAQPLQPLIDVTPRGGVLSLAAGDYDGPVVIDKPMIVDGNGIAVLRGGGSGASNDGMDAGGAAITFKDSGESLVEGNQVVNCAVGLEANTPSTRPTPSPCAATVSTTT